MCNRYPKALAIIDKAAKCRFGTAAYNRHMDLAAFCETQDSALLSERIRSDFKRAIDKATKRIRWDYKTAVPIYYPAYNLLSLMIPLCLNSDNIADVALLVEKNGIRQLPGAHHPDSAHGLSRCTAPVPSQFRLAASQPDFHWRKQLTQTVLVLETNRSF